MEFVGRLFAGERMTDLCRGYGITRQTGYALKKRYLKYGKAAFFDRSRRPNRSPYQTPDAVVELLVRWREKHPTWGPKKLKAEIPKKERDVKLPAASTIGEILSRKNLVKPRKKRRRAPPSHTALTDSQAANELWCADFKGQFRLGDWRYCHPFTLTDHFSRFSLVIDALENTAGEGVRPACEAVFEEYGLPQAIRVDNGAPFASTGLAGLTWLSVWWMRLGIEVQRIAPGHPEQNGRHERFHLTLKQETTRPPKHNILQQQERFDEFRREYNEARPHEALGMRYPAELYTSSERPFPGELAPLEYPLHDEVKQVRSSGQLDFLRYRDVYISKALTGQWLGLRELDDRWLVSFMDLDLGYLMPGKDTLVPL
jgi:transposase InsO family protein